MIYPDFKFWAHFTTLYGNNPRIFNDWIRSIEKVPHHIPVVVDDNTPDNCHNDFCLAYLLWDSRPGKGAKDACSLVDWGCGDLLFNEFNHLNFSLADSFECCWYSAWNWGSYATFFHWLRFQRCHSRCSQRRYNQDILHGQRTKE